MSEENPVAVVKVADDNDGEVPGTKNTKHPPLLNPVHIADRTFDAKAMRLLLPRRLWRDRKPAWLQPARLQRPLYRACICMGHTRLTIIALRPYKCPPPLNP